MSPPILKGTKVVMVVISDCIAYLNYSEITKLSETSINKVEPVQIKIEPEIYHESFEINCRILNAFVLFIYKLG